MPLQVRRLLGWSLVGLITIGGLYELQHRRWRHRDAAVATAAPARDAGAVDEVPADAAVEMVGVVVAQDDAVLGFKSAGKIVVLKAQVGDQVALGQTLAELDPAEALREVGQAKARVSSAQAELQSAWVKVKQARDRLARLEETAQFISQEKLESARSQARVEQASAAQAQARVQQEREALAMVQLSVNETAMRAPFAGTVSAVLAQRGARVTPNQPVIRLVGLGEKVVRFAVPEALLERVAEHAAVKVELSSTRQVSGVVERLAPGFDPTLRYRLAEASLEAKVNVPAGIPVTVRLTGPQGPPAP
ncbi:MAG: efflux RND transporter periplasmic adaptor subunit [Archangiaceae bacterium]|nr:efflux RND transporter periplasmic adaptor subunit [Archangiaceae bacterium]